MIDFQSSNASSSNKELFDKLDFYGINSQYHFENNENIAFPTMGMQIDLQAGYRQNIDSGKGYGYLIPQLGFDYKLASRGQLVFATNFRAHLNIGNDY